MVSDHIKAQIAAGFLAQDRDVVEWALDCYGVESYEREIERVQTALVFLTRGNPDKLLEYVQMAKRDYRDILLWNDLEHARAQADSGNLPI